MLILDFGAQYTQLIARRVREAGVYCEILPCTVDDDRIRDFSPRAVILSGGPASTTEADAPKAPEVVFDLAVPLLGICYGEQAICAQLGGKVEIADHREFGRAMLDIHAPCALFDGVFDVGTREQVWMSHGDKITALPPGFEVVATSEGSPFAAIADESRKIYGVQFHPEVVHTPKGAALLTNFVRKIAGCSGDWSMAAFRGQAIERIREQVGDGRVICGLSGGVDSSVTALLLHEAIGEQLVCVFVDTGLLRAGEAEQIVSLFRGHFNIPLVHADEATCSWAVCRASPIPNRSERSSARPSSTYSRPSRKRSAVRTSSPRARSIPMSSKASRSRVRASPSSPTTMSAACPSACA